MNVSVTLPDDGDYRCSTCGCVFQIKSSISEPEYCPQCGERLNSKASPEEPKRNPRGKRVSREQMDRMKIARRKLREGDASEDRQRTEGLNEERGDVEQAIKDLVDAEDKRSPLTEEQIVKSLNKMNINVARRTVAKIRKKLGIPSSRQRRISDDD